MNTGAANVVRRAHDADGDVAGDAFVGAAEAGVDERDSFRGAPSRPVIAVEAAVLNGFGEVLGGDGGGLIEIGDGSGDFEHAVVGAGGEAHAADGHFERALAGIVECADLADIAG